MIYHCNLNQGFTFVIKCNFACNLAKINRLMVIDVLGNFLLFRSQISVLCMLQGLFIDDLFYHWTLRYPFLLH